MQTTMRITKHLAMIVAALVTGIVIGGYLFSSTQARSILQLPSCQHCLSKPELLGLLASAGIQKTSGLMPDVVYETDKSIAISNPTETAFADYVIFPKRDIRDLSEISEQDLPYVYDCLLVARHIIETKKLRRFRVYTNGPDLQEVRYLHFHVVEH